VLNLFKKDAERDPASRHRSLNMGLSGQHNAEYNIFFVPQEWRERRRAEPPKDPTGPRH